MIIEQLLSRAGSVRSVFMLMGAVAAVVVAPRSSRAQSQYASCNYPLSSSYGSDLFGYGSALDQYWACRNAVDAKEAADREREQQRAEIEKQTKAFAKDLARSGSETAVSNAIGRATNAKLGGDDPTADPTLRILDKSVTKVYGSKGLNPIARQAGETATRASIQVSSGALSQMKNALSNPALSGEGPTWASGQSGASSLGSTDWSRTANVGANVDTSLDSSVAAAQQKIEADRREAIAAAQQAQIAQAQRRSAQAQQAQVAAHAAQQRSYTPPTQRYSPPTQPAVRTPDPSVCPGGTFRFDGPAGMGVWHNCNYNTGSGTPAPSRAVQ